MLLLIFRRVRLLGAVLVLGALVPAMSASAATVIVVTTASDVVNGDVSSVEALVASPGSDGISLREAIEATNNDPGTYTISFARNLQGATIALASELPPLTGGGVTLRGSAAGSGQTAIAIAKSPNFATTGLGNACRQGGGCYPMYCWGTADPGVGCGLIVASSNNQVSGVTIEGFSVGVLLTPWRPGDLTAATLPSGVAVSHNAITSDVIDAEGNGVEFGSAINENCGPNGNVAVVCETGDSWLDTTITGNTISIPATGTGGNGIHANIANGNDEIAGLTISDNSISDDALDVAIQIITGGNGDPELASQILVSHNRINAVDGMEVSAGGFRSKNTTIQGVQILDNTLVLHRAPGEFRTEGIVVHSGGDLGPINSQDTDFRTSGDVLEDVTVARNAISGSFDWGIESDTGVVAGESNNQTLNLRIENNAISTTSALSTGILIANFGERPLGQTSLDDRIANVVISGDRISAGKTLIGGSDFPGGIVIAGGLGPVRSSSISNVTIAHVVVTGGRHPQPALISVIGGCTGASGNTVQDVHITNSKLSADPRTPVAALNVRVNDSTDDFPGLPKTPSTGNSIKGLTVKGTVLASGVAGVIGDASVVVISHASH